MNHFLRCYATRLLTTLTAILLSTAARSQETLTVYEYIPSDYENNYSAYIPVDFLDFDEYSRSQFVIPAADLAIMEGGTITGISFYEASMKTYTTDCSVDVYLKEVSSTTINAFVSKASSTVVYHGKLSVIKVGEFDNYYLIITFDTPYHYGGGNLLIGFENTEKGTENRISFYGQTIAGTSIYGSSSSSQNNITTATQANFIPQTIFTYTPKYSKPANLTVNTLTDTEATLSWTSPSAGSPLRYTYEYKPAGSSVWQGETTVSGSGLSFNVTIPNLTQNTDYDFRVKAIYSDGESDYATTSFTTEYDPSLPLIKYTLNDSGYDGWNGGKLLVVHTSTGETVETLSLSYSDEPTVSGTLMLAEGETYNLVWVKGSYDSEVSFTVTDVKNNVIISTSKPTAGTLATFTIAASSYPPPTDLTASSINYNSATISWTENSTATAWQICINDNESNPINVSTRPYTITGLTENTQYTVKVRAAYTNKMSNWSLPITIKTPEQYPTPTNLIANNITPSSASIGWTGTADAYNLRYRKYAGSPSSAQVTLTAGNVFNDGTGFQMLLDADADSYGTVFPVSGHTNFFTSIGDADEASYAEFEYKIPENADGALTTKNIVFNNTISIMIPAGTYDWCIVNPEPSGRVWIVEDNGDVKGSENDYTFEAGKTYAFTVKDATKGAGVFLSITDMDGGGDIEWTEISNLGNTTYSLTGLSDECIYEVQVQAIYGSNKSEWTSIYTFETISFNKAPGGLDTPAIKPEDATLAWDTHDYHDSYNLRWRKAEYEDIIFEEDFESGLDRWTYLDNNENGLESMDVLSRYGLIQTENAKSGINIFSFKNYRSSTTESYLISPELSVISSNAELSLFFYGPGKFRVGYSTTGNDPTDFTWNSEKTNYNESTWFFYNMDLPVGTKYVAIKSSSTTLQFDNIFVSGDRHPAGEWQLVNNVSSPYHLTGLTQKTNYEWEVQGNYADNVTDWSTTNSFYTLGSTSNYVIDYTLEGVAVVYHITDWENKTAEISNSGIAAIPTETTGTITIPETINFNGTEFSVTAIGEKAFYNCSTLGGIHLPNTCTSIGTSAFSGCTALATVGDLTKITHIGDRAFSKCQSLSVVILSSANACDITSVNVFDGSLPKHCKLYITGGTAAALAGKGWTADIFQGGIYEMGGMKGDVDNDGEVTAQDASLIQQKVAGKIEW